MQFEVRNMCIPLKMLSALLDQEMNFAMSSCNFVQKYLLIDSHCDNKKIAINHNIPAIIRNVINILKNISSNFIVSITIARQRQ